MNKIAKQLVSHETVIFTLGSILIILLCVGINYYKTKSDLIVKTQNTIIIESLRSGVHKDSLKKALSNNCDTLK